LALDKQQMLLDQVGLQGTVHWLFPSFSTNKVWRADAEPKCTMFSWLVLHEKILTADRLSVRGCPHYPIYQLCLHAPEMACHLCKDFPFTAMVWTLVHAWSLNPCPHALSPGLCATMNDWWEVMLVGADNKTKRSRSGMLLYVIWNVWKERNRRIFQGGASYLSGGCPYRTRGHSPSGTGFRGSHTDGGSQ
jgi:hypothetical protein